MDFRINVIKTDGETNYIIYKKVYVLWIFPQWQLVVDSDRREDVFRYITKTLDQCK